MIRTGFIGASDFAAILGLSRWKTAHQLWLEKTGQAESSPSSLRQEVGTELEALVLRKFAERSGLDVRPWAQDPLIHPLEPWLRVQPDGRAHSKDGVSLVEAKTCAFAKRDDGWGPEGSADVPAGYFAQVQIQLLVARANGIPAGSAYIPCLLLNRLSDEKNPQIFQVPFDAEMAEGLLQKGREFWRCVTERIPPTENMEAA